MEAGFAVSTGLWALVAGAFVLSLAVGIVLAFHWFKYATSTVVPFIATTVYAIVCTALLICLVALAFSL